MSLGRSQLREYIHTFSFIHSVAKLCLTLSDPARVANPGSSVHEISRARVLEWVTISFSRGSSQPRDGTRVFRIAVSRFTI